MTDRLKGCYVVFEKDIRVDDAEGIIKALAMVKGVLEVRTEVASFQDAVAYSRARNELGEKLMDVLYPELKGKS